MGPTRPTEKEREHFRRIARVAAAQLDDEASPPASLGEMFDRLEALHRALGRFAEARDDDEDLSELEAHLRVMRRLRSQDGDGTRRG